MFRKKRDLVSLTDGVADFYRETAAPSSFGARINQTDPSEMEHLEHLHYTLASCREEDYQAAERLGFNLAMRIRTYDRPTIRTGDKCVVDGMLYDVRDADRTTRPWCWWSLGGGIPVPEHEEGGGNGDGQHA